MMENLKKVVGRMVDLCYNKFVRRISTLVVYQLPKLRRRVRFPYPALKSCKTLLSYGFFIFRLMRYMTAGHMGNGNSDMAVV